MNNIIDPVAISSITLTSHLLVYFNSSINPVIYNFMSGSYLCYIIWLSDNLSLSVPDEGGSRNVPDEGGSRNTSCALSSISTFLLHQ